MRRRRREGRRGGREASLAGAEAGGGVVATHEGEVGVRRAQREEDELPDPLGLHGGGSARLGWGGGGSAVRSPSAVAAGGMSGAELEGSRGDSGWRTAASGGASGVYGGRTGWFGNGFACTDGGGGCCEFWYVGPEFLLGCSSPPLFEWVSAQICIYK